MSHDNSNINLHLFVKLPIDMKRYVYNFIDYDTKTTLILHERFEFMTNKNLYSILTVEKIKKATKNGLIDKIYKNTITTQDEINNEQRQYMNYTMNYTRKLRLHNNILKLLPKSETYTYRSRNGLLTSVERFHPMVDELVSCIRTGIYVNSEVKAYELITGFDTLRNLRSFDSNMLDVNYLFSKLAYQLLVSLIIYCDVVKRDRIERSKRALANLTVKRAIREKKKLEERLENTEREIQQLEEQDTQNYQARIKRMNTRFMKENVYMQYVNQGMTLREAKDRVYQDKVNKKKEDMWKRWYIKAVKEATKKRKQEINIALQNEKEREQKRKREETARKNERKEVRKKVIAYMKIAKEVARLAKDKRKNK